MAQNIVLQAILDANMTKKDVSVACNICDTSVSKICNGSQVPTPDQIERISIFLRNYDLPEQYCATYCPIGKRKNPDGYEGKDLKTLGYMIPRMLTDQQKFLDEIHKALEDGEFNRNEEILLSEYLPKIYEQIELMQNVASNLEKFKRR